MTVQEIVERIQVSGFPCPTVIRVRGKEGVWQEFHIRTDPVVLMRALGEDGVNIYNFLPALRLAMGLPDF